MDACCSGRTDPGIDAVAAELDELALDPTLESCCQRDLQQQASAARLRSRLAVQDRSMVAAKQRAAVFGQPTGVDPEAALSLAPLEPQESGSSDLDDDNDPREQRQGGSGRNMPWSLGALLSSLRMGSDAATKGTACLRSAAGVESLRAQRMQQLKHQAAVKQQAAAAGYGHLNTVSESGVLVRGAHPAAGLGRRSGAPCVTPPPCVTPRPRL